MNKADLYAHPGWQWCTAEGARKQVLLLGIKSTLREKLEWLEEAETITLRLRANRPNSYPAQIWERKKPMMK
jgi:hypothetical protein